MSKHSVFALYARVSSDKQAKDKTIDSQIAVLKERIIADGGTLVDDMMFVDAGVSGATLVRPELERLRDCAAVGAIGSIYCHRIGCLVSMRIRHYYLRSLHPLVLLFIS